MTEKHGVDYSAFVREIEELLIGGVSLRIRPQTLDQIYKSSVSYLTKHLPSLARSENKEMIEKILANIDKFTEELIKELMRKGNIENVSWRIGSKGTMGNLYSFKGGIVKPPSDRILSYVENVLFDVQKIPIREVEMDGTESSIYNGDNFLENFIEGLNELTQEFGLLSVMGKLKEIAGRKIRHSLIRVSLDHENHYISPPVSPFHVVEYDFSSRRYAYVERKNDISNWEEKDPRELQPEVIKEYGDTVKRKLVKLKYLLKEEHLTTESNRT